MTIAYVNQWGPADGCARIIEGTVVVVVVVVVVVAVGTVGGIVGVVGNNEDVVGDWADAVVAKRKT